MKQKSKLELLKHSPLAMELNENQCMVLAQAVDVHQLEKGEILLKEGSTDNCLYALVSGNMAVVKKVGGDSEKQLHLMKPGELAGAMGFLDRREHSATLRATSKAEVLSLDRDKFEALIDDNPYVVYQVMLDIARGVHSIVRNMNDTYIQLSNYITQGHGRY